MGIFLLSLFSALVILVIVAWSRLKGNGNRQSSPRRAALPQGNNRVHLTTPTINPVVESAAPGSSSKSEIPDSLPLSTKRWFFSQSERTLFLHLLKVVEETPYSVFPNVRLNDIFQIAKSDPNQRGTYARLRDKHVDFLIVEGSDFRPVLAIELDGASHDNAVQQYRDEVKNVAFRSAGLRLIRLDARKYHNLTSLRALLGEHLPTLQALAQSAD